MGGEELLFYHRVKLCVDSALSQAGFGFANVTKKQITFSFWQAGYDFGPILKPPLKWETAILSRPNALLLNRR